MSAESTPQDLRNIKRGQIGLSANQFGLSPDELAHWNENGYLVRLDVFTPEENDALRQVAEDIVDGKRPFPSAHIDQNALVRDGKTESRAATNGIFFSMTTSKAHNNGSSSWRAVSATKTV